jgi:release factor glutamine methyltransferase
MDNWGELGLVAGQRLLEIGCGAGPLAIHATRMGLDVLATDIDEVSVECARKNAAANEVELKVIKSDLFDAVPGDRYDCILFNQPFFHDDGPVDPIQRPLVDQQGKTFSRFLDAAHDHLTPDGSVIFTFSNCSRIELLDSIAWDFSLLGLDYVSSTRFIRALIRGKPLRV